MYTVHVMLFHWSPYSLYISYKIHTVSENFIEGSETDSILQ